MSFVETQEMKDDNCGPTIYVRDDGFEGTISIAMTVRHGRGSHSMAKMITMEEKKEGQFISPFLTLQRDTVQNIFNQMWSLGFRPKDGTGNSGHMDAMKNHLEDMRRLVFREET
jgi:hypothetical protein